jgi:aspartate racemase
MKKIGIVGGLSWESSANYYKWINEGIRDAHDDGLVSAQILLSSVNFKPFTEMQKQGKWDEMGEIIITEMQNLEKAGADFILLATNTMHKLSGQYEENLHVPFIHIAYAVSENILTDNFNKVGLLGTAYTMQQDFYKDRLKSNGLSVEIPTDEECAEINRVIFEELCQGKITDESKKYFDQVIETLLHDKNCDAIILGCTEISMLTPPEKSDIPLYDTAKIHCKKAVQLAMC